MAFSGNDAEGFRFDGFDSGTPNKKEKKPFSTAKRVAINVAVTLLVAAVVFYVELPAINPHSLGFYFYLLLLCGVYCFCALLTSGHRGGAGEYFRFFKKQCTVPFYLAVLLVAIVLVGSLAGSTVLRANRYAKLLTITAGDFAEEVEEISYSQIPMLDRASAERLGDRKLGELSDMVSQFEVADDYIQINYQGRPVRVASLLYADAIKWLSNRRDGLPAYLMIDMVTQNVELVRLEEGIHYTTAEHFGRNLYRYLRFHYPTFLFDDPVMEIDEEGTPYWICPRLVKTIGLFDGTDVKGAVLVNAITGESQYWEEVPTWVDHLHSAELIIQQYDYYGMYHNGFLNSIFGQKDVTVTTDGYNYIAINDDVYVYTGITSTGGDQSNIGFILTNQRTKETKFYSCAGATEYSAMASAEGELQNLRYAATFPLLLNVGGEATYFMAMKDDAQLVKKYAMVNVQQYQVVATGDTVAECEKNYVDLLGQNGIVIGERSTGTTGQAEGTIAEIRSAVREGNTYYYFRLEGHTVFYTISAVNAPIAVILNVGDQVAITYSRDTTVLSSVEPPAIWDAVAIERR